MRSLLFIASVAGFCAAGRLDNNYLPPNSAPSQRAFGGPAFGHTQPGQGSNFGPIGGGASFRNAGNAGAYQSGGNAGAHQSGGNAGAYQSGGNAGAYQSGGYGAASARQQSSQEVNAQILRSNSDVNEHGYAYDFETSNGIRADQSASAVNGVQAQGSFGYKGDDGHDYSISYTADENGYQPRGDHLPTSPPIPEAILRSLEQNAREEAAGGSSDGSYRSDSSSYNGGAGGGAHQGSAFQPQVLANTASRQYLAPRQQPYSPRSGYNY